MTPGSKTQPPDSEAHLSPGSRTVLNRFTVVLLLFTVAGLFTLAKTGQYYPKSSSTQQISVSIKMNVAHSTLETAEEPRQAVICLLPPQPLVRPQQAQLDEPLLTVPVGVTVSMQHRSPPFAFA